MMKKLMLPLALICLIECIAQEKLQLAPPLFRYSSAFFNGETTCHIIFNQPGAEIRYTLDGSEPTETSPLYKEPITIRKRTVVQARAVGKNYKPSETITAHFISDGLPLKKTSFSKPNEYYSSAKADILNDNIGGITNYRSGTWLGYDSDTVTIEAELNQVQNVKSILINLLQDEGSWIFMPEQIVVYYLDTDKKEFSLLGQEIFNHNQAGEKTCRVIELNTSHKVKTDRLKFVLLPLKKIPDWHTGKGQHGWLFIDEIKVY